MERPVVPEQGDPVTAADRHRGLDGEGGAGLRQGVDVEGLVRPDGEPQVLAELRHP
ncbi:hypothetical protein [Streptomyces sp. NPDC005181]|uniref:hypothetical protein n=1 Tax=Streptomyces sp. NPDC005181 TaxID=3156869 RepID=UPI0033A3B5B0